MILTSNLFLSRFAQMQKLVVMLNLHFSRKDFSTLATVTEGPTAFLKDPTYLSQIPKSPSKENHKGVQMQCACSSNFSKRFVRRNTTKIVYSSTEPEDAQGSTMETFVGTFWLGFFSSFKDLT